MVGQGRVSPRGVSLALIAVAMLIAPATSAQNLGSEFGAKGADNAGSIELVDPKVLRVCADPNNMPFSNDKGDGFENKIARLLAEKLNKDVAYTYYPGATGFIRNTLNAHLCDVVLGMPQGNDLVQPTNPYYRTTYAIVTRAEFRSRGFENPGRSATKRKWAAYRPRRQYAAGQSSRGEWIDERG